MENPDGLQSRIFVIVAISLVGLLMVGIVSIAGLVIYTRILAPSATPPVAITTPTATQVPGVTATATPVPGLVTPTAGEFATATRVIGPGASPTPGESAATATPTGQGEIPDTGFGPLEAVVGGIVLLVIILFVRRLRMSGQT
jgi:hypothetical protein